MYQPYRCRCPGCKGPGICECCGPEGEEVGTPDDMSGDDVAELLYVPPKITGHGVLMPQAEYEALTVRADRLAADNERLREELRLLAELDDVNCDCCSQWGRGARAALAKAA